MTDSKASSSAGSHSSGAPIGAAKSAPPLPPTSSPVSTRLYIGNLPPSLTEYHLAALFSPFGELTKIDYLWHKHGPHRGEPRGYCFIEYADVRSACAAVEAFSGGDGGGDDKRSRVVNGRPRLVVRFSVESAEEEGGGGGGGHGRDKIASSVGGGVLSTASGGGGAMTPTTTRKRTKGAMDVARNSREMQEPVNAKLQARVGHTSMNSKISAIERKLLQLQSSSQQQPSSLHLSLQPSPRLSSSSLNSRGTGSGSGCGGGGGGVGGSAVQNESRRTAAAANVRHKPYDKRVKE
ncbi:hypothetical protein BDZ88DRAFT_508696 [Geranomyces variabilis]|nr:hypothetical protein BDZ88DRAFT_508696 [Geranomyces variabilis]